MHLSGDPLYLQVAIWHLTHWTFGGQTSKMTPNWWDCSLPTMFATPSKGQQNGQVYERWVHNDNWNGT